MRISLLLFLGASLAACDAGLDPADVPFNPKNPFEPGAHKLGDTACAIDERYDGKPTQHTDVEFDAEGHIVRTVHAWLDTADTASTRWETVQTWSNGRLVDSSASRIGGPIDSVTRFVRNGHGVLMREDYDGESSLESPADGVVNSMKFYEYDERGLPSRILEDPDADTQPDGRIVDLVFDEREQLVLFDATDADGRQTVAFSYDDAGHRIRRITDLDGDGNADYVTAYHYDELGRLASEEQADAATTYEYVGDSLEPSRMVRGGLEQRWTYDCPAPGASR